MISIKKALFAFTAAVSLAASVSSSAAVQSWDPSTNCDYILNMCYQGMETWCEQWRNQCEPKE
ncbi:hypothetical protein ACL9RI_15075 [Janthinobacterium sp. Mn2066]|uniref:hypothetical protein n=1 Tax=Janthinobacterium sp. Mn2066 TaxID=3395264 RepID=UPI003BD5D560